MASDNPMPGFSAIDQAASYAPVTPAVQPEETVSGQLNGLLDGENPYIKRARLRGTQYANKRGLLNSSFGAQAAEAAAIDAALPIAQGDANAFFQRAGQNAQAQNDQLGFLARARADTVMNALADAQKRGQLRLSASLKSAQEGTKQTAGLYAQYLDAAAKLNQADMAIEDKQQQVDALKQAMVEGVNTVSQMYQTDFGNVDLEGAVPGEGAYIANIFNSIDAAFAGL